MRNSGAGRRARAAFGWVALLAGLAGVARAGDLTVNDLIELKRVGFSDADIWRELETSSSKPLLTEADASSLEDAGFGEDFIRRLRGSGATLTLADIEALHADGHDAAAILRRIAAAGARPRLGAADAVRLAKAGVTTSVLRGLRPEPLA